MLCRGSPFGDSSTSNAWQFFYLQPEEPTVPMMFMKCAAFGATALMFAGTAQAAGLPGQGTWKTTLLPRDLNGDSVADAFYDTTLDLTWLRNANANGVERWNAAKAWAAGLDVYGVKGWRLPTLIDTGPVGCDISYVGGTDCGYNVQTKSGDPTKYEPGQTVYSEMAHLFFVTLANKAYCAPGGCMNGPQPGWGLTNTGDFQNMGPVDYWSGLEYEYPPDPTSIAWKFDANFGYQFYAGKVSLLYAMAVHPGDVPAVPEPQAYAMLLLGLGAVLVVARRRPHRRFRALSALSALALDGFGGGMPQP
jgi:hypothetical protein